MAKKPQTTNANPNVEIIETASTGETATPETNVVEENTMNELPVETATPEENKEYTAVEMICSGCDDLDVEELKQVIEYCSSRIDELQREEVEALEAQMRAIQDKLMAMKGFRGKQVVENGEKQKRTAIPLVNPNNPSEVYTFGKHPDWLVRLMAKTGKDVGQLRNETTLAAP